MVDSTELTEDEDDDEDRAIPIIARVCAVEGKQELDKKAADSDMEYQVLLATIRNGFPQQTHYSCKAISECTGTFNSRTQHSVHDPGTPNVLSQPQAKLVPSSRFRTGACC